MMKPEGWETVLTDDSSLLELEHGILPRAVFLRDLLGNRQEAATSGSVTGSGLAIGLAWPCPVRHAAQQTKQGKKQALPMRL
uniref:Uncharacterized protein n=1 Tax=Peronospora matthiolae TaxID=2874970 RepID=A0AAV1TJU1_9STRA